ncbi:MAG: amidohydrolase family protein [Candidatus Latescibacteria bacterium]|nr:amidohydrolase family protein [Candidatus Latescibacterota bacterium]
MFDYDLIIYAGRVFCEDTGLDGPGAVAIVGDRVVESGAGIAGSAKQTLRFPDAVLLPGLIDMHAHPGLPETRYGVDPDVEFLRRGVTTVLSQGDAGAGDLDEYLEKVIAVSKTRVLLALNLSRTGEKNPIANMESIDDADTKACIAAIESGGDAIWGISFNTGTHNPVDPHEVMDRGLSVAEATDSPILFGSRQASDWSLDDQLALLRPGDILTYCFNGRPENLLEDGAVRTGVLAASDRGIRFDVGHGMASFSYSIAEPCIEQGFWPDTISSDQYREHTGSVPQHDLPRTLSKLIAAGMPEEDAFARVTSRPAELLGLSEEIGTLMPGACADLAVLKYNERASSLEDVDGVKKQGGCWEPVATVRAGEVVS